MRNAKTPKKRRDTPTPDVKGLIEELGFRPRRAGPKVPATPKEKPVKARPRAASAASSAASGDVEAVAPAVEIESKDGDQRCEVEAQPDVQVVDPAPVVSNDKAGERDAAEPATTRRLITVRVADLRPNALNGKVFKESLSDASIAELADDIKVHGLRQPIEIRPDMTIIDGERRWRAMGRNGAEMIAVFIIEGVATEHDLAAYILDAQQATRRTSMGEKLKLYKLGLRVLKEQHGRPKGRPGKSVRNEQVFWPPEKIEAEAAKKAGFTSAGVARKAEYVLDKADASLKDLVNLGEIAISTAYDRLLDAEKPKGTGPRTTRARPSSVPKATVASTTRSASGAQDGVSAGDGAAVTEDVTATTAAPQGQDGGVAPSDSSILSSAAAGHASAVAGPPPSPEAEPASIVLVAETFGADPAIEAYNKVVSNLVDILQVIAKQDPATARRLMKALPERLKAVGI